MSNESQQAGVASLSRFLTSRSGHTVSVDSGVEALGSIEDAKKILGVIMAPGADFGRVKQIWPLLTKKFDKPIMMEWLKLWMRQAAQTAAANRRPFESTHLISIFSAMFSTQILSLFTDINKFKDVLSALFSLVGALSNAPRRRRRVAFTKLRRVIRADPRVYDMCFEMVKAKPDAKWAAALIETLLRTPGDNLNKHRGSFFEFYEKMVLAVRGKVAQNVKNAFVPLLNTTSEAEFKEKLWGAITRQLKRSPDSLDVSLHLFTNIKIDTSDIGKELLSIIQDYLQSADDEIRRNSAGLLNCVLASCRRDLATVQLLFDMLLPIVNAGSSNWYARFGATQALASVGRAFTAPAPAQAEKAVPVILKSLEKESNKDCLDASLSCLATFLRLDPSKLTEKVAAVIIKGSTDKDTGKMYLLSLFNSVRDVHVDGMLFPDSAAISTLSKALLQIVASAKTKIALAPEAMLCAASLSILASRDTSLSEQLKTCGSFWNLLFTTSDSILFSGSPSLLDRLTTANDGASLQAFASLLASVLRFHSAVITDTTNIVSMLVQLILSEKKLVRDAALAVVDMLHPHVSTLSSKMLDIFQNTTLPALAARRLATEYLEGIPSEQQAILRKALLSIVYPTLLSSDAPLVLSSLFLVAHHPLLVKPRDTAACWKRVVAKLGFSDTNSVNDQHAESLIDALLSESAFKSVDTFKRGAAVHATTTLLQGSDSVPNKVLDSVAKLLDPSAFFALTREERGIILTPPTRVFRQAQLKEYIPDFKMDKNVKTDDDEIETQRKLNEARRKHFLMVEEKLRKAEAEQLVAEQKVRERVLPVYTSLRTAIEAVIVSAQHSKCVHAFAHNDAAFLFRTVDYLYDILYFEPLFNDLSPLAARSLAVLSSHVLPHSLRQKVGQCLTTVVPTTPLPRLALAKPPQTTSAPKKTGGVSLASSSASANNKQKEDDELALAEKRASRASVESFVVDKSSGVSIDASSWSLLQVVFGSVFTPIHPVEIQERSVAQFQRHLSWVNQRLVNTLVNVLEFAPFVADEARAALEEACSTHLTPFKPLHYHAVPALVKHASVHPNAEVRKAVLKALRKVMPEKLRGFGQQSVVVPHLWLAKFDTEDNGDASESSLLATQIYQSYSQTQDPSERPAHSLNADYFAALSKPLCSSFEVIRNISARALVGAMKLFPATQAATFDSLLALYKQHSTQQLIDAEASGRSTANLVVEAHDDLNWRRGIASALKHSRTLESMTPELLVLVFKFLCEQAIYDPNPDIYDRFLQAGIEVLNLRGGGAATSPLQTLLESYLSSAQPQTERQHRARQSVVVFLGTLAQHLIGGSNDAAADRIMEKLLEVLRTPSEPVQRSVAQCLTALAPRLSSTATEKILRQCLDGCLTGEDYGDRRGCAYGIAGIIRGLKVAGLRKYSWLMEKLEQAAGSKESELARQGASLAFECISLLFGRYFEPWVMKILPHLLNSLGDGSQDVRECTAEAAKAIMSQLTGNGMNLVLPALLKALDSTEKGSKWRARAGAIDLIGSMAYCQPDQLGRCLPTIIPKLSGLLADTHNQVQKAARDALNALCGVIRNPEISKVVPALLKAVDDPVQHTSTALEALAHTHFVNRIDSPSLALIMPVLDRALRDRQTETKKNATKIVGTMVSLTEPGALKPYSKPLLEHLKVILADPIPQTRTAAAVALGLVSRGLDAAHDIVPNLLETMKAETGTIERAGSAQGLAHVVAHALDLNNFKFKMLPSILAACGPPATSSARQGNLALFQYLPEALGHRFESLLSVTLPTVIRGLADESESVRDAALKAGQAIVARFGDEDKVDLVIPTLQHAMFNDNWRIRTSSTQLLSELLYKISGADTSFADKDIAPMLANPDRQGTLATLYVLRQDLNAVVRQNAGHVWKLLVVNTPKTLRTILPNLMDIIIELMSSQDEEKRDISSKTLGELVEKLGERVLGDILPILNKELQWSPHATTRVGVILGMTEILSVSRLYIGPFVDEIFIPSIRNALCDANSDVREAASLAFDELYKCVNEKAIDGILPPLLAQMEDPNPDQSELALHGLQQMLTKRSALILPSIIPKLTNTAAPLSSFNARALASIAEVSNEGFFPFLRDITAIFMRRMYGSGASSTQIEPMDEETRESVEKSLHRIVTCMRGQGLSILFVDMFRYMQENNPMLRVGAMDLIGTVCRDAKAKQADPTGPQTILDDHLPNLIQAALRAFNDPFQKVVETALKSLSAIMALIVVKEDAQNATATNYVQAINDVLETMGLVEGATLAGFNLPGGLTPILPMFLQVLRTGSQDEREQSALGIRLMLERTEQAQLKPYLQQITGPLIRILAERTLTAQTRTAMLQTLNQVVTKGGVALRPFAAQLQTTYVKALGATTKVVRDQAAQGIKLLLVLGAKADFLIKDLIKQMLDPNTPATDACLDAIVGVLKGLPAGVSGLSAASVSGIRQAAQPLLAAQDPQHRAAAARALGTTCRFSEESDATDFIKSVLVRGQGETWLECDGGLLTLNVILSDPSREPFTAHLHEQGVLFPYLLDMLKHHRAAVRCAAIQCVGSTMIHLAEQNEKLVADLADRLAEMLSDENNDVKIAALVAIKEFAKARPGHAADQLNVLVPPIMNKIKEKKVLPIKFAAERALLHVLQIKLDPRMPLLEHYATKILTDKELAKQLVDYCKRVLSKLPQFSEDEEDGGFSASVTGGKDL